ncbi:MAG TPA: alpha-glucan family phosphorylase [Leifsonia sp.]|nr:alpha-glucan family phosphorylase [Leifsonia sp.]
MKAIRRFTVRAVLPENLGALEELAGNLRWSWHEPTRQLFARIAPELWQQVGHDPIALLGGVDPSRLAELAADQGYVDWANRLRDDLHAYLTEPRWYQSLDGSAPRSIGYFSPEFGIAAALPQYSGGLGILAGDHLKSASDLGVPLIGVGLFYRAGYFSQAITPDGWQLESYPVLDPDGLPLSVLRNPDGTPVQITLALPNGVLHARVWQAAVGRVTLLLLDTDIPDNEERLRSVTDRLYGGGGEHRLLQELLLGIGGVRAIKAYTELSGTPDPEVFHTNEGHAGFLGLERISDLIGEGLGFDEALQVVRAGTVFTTHTPVPAGIDRFDRPLVEQYFSTDLLPGVTTPDVLALGAEDYTGGSPDVFNMAVMGLRLGQHANGVSQLHGEVSRHMFNGVFPGFDPEEVPIDSVTNGVHAPTWTDPMLRELAEERLGTDDTTTADWANSGAVSDLDLWSLRTRMREQLVEDARRRLQAAWENQNPGGIAPSWMSDLLDPSVLTIGFARRVPTYKRLTLMLHNPERLRGILLHAERPVQIVIAGKSHPADDEGKRLIQKLVQFASEPDIRARLVFLPDYDIGMAQLLYPGTDIWLNNPLRPLEACGTSGMKAALNGALNLSILDGWWNEYYDGENGWAIPSADAAGDGAERDALEAEALYDLIENQIAPRFYERNGDGVPEAWVGQIRHTLSTLSPELSADRMVREYVERLYVPATEYERRLTADGYTAARSLAAWKQRVRAAWSGVNVAHVESGGVDAVPQVGDELHVRALIHLNGLSPDEVEVQVVYGRSHDGDHLTDVRYTPLEVDRDAPGSEDPSIAREYRGTVQLAWAGAFGYTVRVVPKNDLLLGAAELGLVAIAS